MELIHIDYISYSNSACFVNVYALKCVVSLFSEEVGPLKPVRCSSRMRPPNAESPKLQRHNIKSESLRQRCNGSKADEMIRFVRDFQRERQPTGFCLQKKAPLPGIGQNSPPKNGTSDSGFIDRATDSNDSDDDILDNEILCTSQRKSQPVDQLFIELLTCPRGAKNSNDYKILSKSMPQSQCDIYGNNNKMPLRQNSFIRHARAGYRSCTTGSTGNQRHILKQLPPLSHDSIPERPSAPSPSRTPPLSDYSFIEEEPVDYIDMS